MLQTTFSFKKEIHLPELPQPVLVRLNSRARRMILRVVSARRQIELTLPPGVKESEARRFLRDNLAWIRNRWQAMPKAVPFAHGETLPLRGVPHVLCFRQPGETAKPDTSLGKPKQLTPSRHEPRQLSLFSETDLPAPSRETPASLALSSRPGENTSPVTLVDGRIIVTAKQGCGPWELRKWLRAQAREDLSARVAIHAKTLKVTVGRLFVRDQTSRWGSCSQQKNLSFSWRLVLAPPAVLDYVAAHEVAHIREMNHSPRFWRLVAHCQPDYKIHRRWLKENGAQLHRYGAEG